MNVNKSFKKNLLASVIIGTLGLSLGGCGSDSKNTSQIVVSEEGIVTISGMVIDAVSREPIANLRVTLSVNGARYTATTNADGAYSFTNVTSTTDFQVDVEDNNSVYAMDSVKGVTPDRMLDVENEVLTVKLADFKLQKSVMTSITAKDITTGEVVTGLSFYYEDAADRSIKAAEENPGVYSFLLPNDDTNETILFEALIDVNGVTYELYSNVGAANAGPITGGKDITLYVKPFDVTEFTVYVHVVDEDGHPMDAGPTLLVGGEYLPKRTVSATEPQLDENGDEIPVALTEVVNEYVLTVNANNMSNTRFISPIDVDGDGFPDYQAKYSNNLEGSLGVLNRLNRGSFDENHELTLVVPMAEVVYNEALQAEIISSDDNFQQGGIAEVIVAFDRPVSLIHQPRMSFDTITVSDVKRNVETSADIYDAERTNQVTSTNNGNFISLNSTTNNYEYTDQNLQPATLSLADANNQVISPYEDEYGSTVNVVDITNSEFLAGNTILKLTVDPATLLADQQYIFELAVEGMLDDNTRATLNLVKTAKSSATATLDEIWLDNFDFKQTPTKDLLDSAAELDNTNQTTFVARFNQINDTYTGGGDALAQLRYLSYGLDINSSQIQPLEPNFYQQNTLYLVSKAKIEGTLQLISQTEKDVDAGVVVTTTHALQQAHYRFDNKSDNVNDNGDLTAISDNQLVENKIYLLDVPTNYGIMGSGINDVYNVDAVTGANSDATGIYYLYKLPVSTISGNYISSVEVNVNLSINGAAVIGEKELIVQ